jgi:hypothetical protein
MDWREEAKELEIPLYDHDRKCPRKKDDVLSDIEATKAPRPEPTKITVSVKDATKICSNALFRYIKEQGLGNATCERWFLNCKRKGIVFKGTRDVRGQESESEGTSPDVPGGVSESEREDSSEGTEEISELQQGDGSTG